MLLSDFLKELSVFEPVDYTRTPRGVEICLGRVPEDDATINAWLQMVGQMLMAQDKEGVDKVSVSRQYLIRGGSLIYLWKIVCKDSKWLSTHMPRIDRTLDWQRQAVSNIDPNSDRWEMTLPGVRKPLALGPQPEDIGQISDAKRENR
jgi:hypothetical protein